MEQEEILLEEQKEDKRFHRFSLWWVEHRALLRRIGFGVFIAIDAAMLLFVSWTMLDSFAISYESEQRAVAEMVAYGQSDLHAYTAANAADDLEAGEPSVFSIGDNRFDLYTTIRNPNSDWWAEVMYYFVTAEGDSEVREGFILPNEEKPFVEIAFEAETPFFDAEIIVSEVMWHRVDHHAISDYDTWLADRISFEVEGAAFTKETNFEDEVYGQTAFSVTNDSAFSYYDPKLFILLKKGSSVSGVNRTTLSEINSGEEVEVSVNWFGTLPSVTSVEVLAEINVFDIDSYKPLDGETTRDTRTRVFSR